MHVRTRGGWLSRGVRISPAKGRAREVGDGRDEGAAIRSFSY